MTLLELLDVLRWHASSSNRGDENIQIITQFGDVHQPLSVSWDRDNECWALITEWDEEYR